MFYNIVTYYLRLRSQIIPYLYTELYHYHKEGIPLIRPLEEILSPERFDINVRLINPRVFKSKYKKALRTSGFNNIIKLIYSDKPEDKRIKDMNLDILALYIKIYKGLYKGGVM